MKSLVGNCRISIDAQGTFRMPDDYWNACDKPFYGAPEDVDENQPHLCLWPGYLAAAHDVCLDPMLLDMDAQQHVTIPLDMLAASGIQPGTEARLIGCGMRIEIWNLDIWDSFVSEMSAFCEGLFDGLD